MFLVAEIALFIFAVYRGRAIDAIGALMVFVAMIITLSEIGYDQGIFIHLCDFIFMAALAIMGFFPKKETALRCPQCDALIGSETMSCKKCGHLLTSERVLERQSDGLYTKTIVMKTLNDFEKIKNEVREHYALLGYIIKVIDSEDSLMLKNAEVKNSYVLVKRDGFDATIEAYKIEEKNLNTVLPIQ